MNAGTRKKETDAKTREREAPLDQPEPAIAQIEPDYTIESIHIRAETITAALEEVLHTCLPPRWEINERTITATEPRKAEKGPAEWGEDI